MALPSTIIGDINADSLTALADNAPITSITDSIGNVVGSQTGTARPTVKKAVAAFNGHDAISFDKTSSQYLDFGDNFDMLTGEFSMFFVAKKTAGDMCFAAKVETPYPAGRYAALVFTGGLPLHGGIYSHAGGIVQSDDAITELSDASPKAYLYEMRFDRANSTIKTYVDGVLKGTGIIAVNSTADLGESLNNNLSFRLGYYGSELPIPFDGLMSRILIGRAMSAQDRTDTYAVLNSAYFPPPPPPPPTGIVDEVTELICDSMFQSEGTAVSETFAFKLATDTGADLTRYTAQPSGSRDDYTLATLTKVIDNGSSKLVENRGIGGRRLNQFLPTAASEVGSKFTGKVTKNLLSMSGLNDLGAFRPLQEIKDNQLALKNFAIAQGADLMVTTLTNIGGAISANTPQVIAYVKTNGKLINDYFRTIHAANKIIPLDENIHFENPLDNLYFLPDQIHLSALGQALWYEIYKKVKAGTYTKPVITTNSLPNGTQNTAYNQLITATGAVASWQDGSDFLPAGLSFNPSTQRYGGNPTESGTFILRPRAVMADGTFGQKEFSVTFASDGSAAPVNYALLSQGATAAANHTYADGGFDGAASNAIDGNRLFSYTDWSANGGIYHSNGGGAVLTINFNQPRTIDKFNLVTVRNSGTDKAPILDNNNEIIGSLGLTGFTVDYWNGSLWVNLFAPVTNNTKLFRSFSFSPIVTTQIRVTATSAGSARIAAVEAFGTPSAPPTNTAPVMSKVDDFTINEDTASVVFPVVVNDNESSAASLVLTAASNNPSLISSIILGGSGINRTFQVIPAANQFGTAVLTLTLSDGNLQSTQAVTVTVISVNDVPTISAIANQTTVTTTPVSVNFSVSDVETPAANLQVAATSSNQTLLPDANLVLFGTGANKTLTATAANGQTGFADVTVGVTDLNGATTTRVFRITVNPASGGDTQNPTISITSPVNNATARGNVLIQATAADNVAVANVTFAVDGIDAATDNSAPYSFTLNTANLTDGVHSITATATDTSNLKTTVGINIQVNNSAPASKVIQLDWDAPDPSVATSALPFAYRLMRSTSADFAQNPTTITLGDVLTHPDTVPANAGGYYYKIQSQNAGGWSVFSAPIYVPLV